LRTGKKRVNPRYTGARSILVSKDSTDKRTSKAEHEHPQNAYNTPEEISHHKRVKRNSKGNSEVDKEFRYWNY
jgi:hypothetical protein